MAFIKKTLTVLHNDNGTFVDRSFDSEDFGRDSFLFEYSNTDSDVLYVGYYKPIDRLYFEMATANTNAAVMTLEYYNGTSFTAVDNDRDYTEGLTRSAFLQWSRGQENEAETTVDSVELYWYRITFDADFSASTAIQGLGLVFSDDNDLKEEYDEINDFLPNGSSSFILKHQAARKEIVQFLRNRGNFKRGKETTSVNESTKVLNINEWDLLNTEQLTQASKFLVLGKIFGNVRDSVDGIWNQLSKDFTAKGIDVLENLFIDIDTDDDGVKDEDERLQQTGIVRITRI